LSNSAYPVVYLRKGVKPHKMIRPHIPGEVCPQPMKIILSLGNTLRGDDGVGAAIIHELATSASLPKNVCLIDGGVAGLRVLFLIQDAASVILIDAADLGREPGEWERFHLNGHLLERWMVKRSSCSHNFGLEDAISLGSSLNLLPPTFVIYGIQPFHIGWSIGLSDCIQRVIPAICSDILKLLHSPTPTEFSRHRTLSMVRDQTNLHNVGHNQQRMGSNGEDLSY
jgi:hydrogenase maturation protease